MSETIIARSGNSLTTSAISLRLRSSGRSEMSSILLNPIARPPLKSTAEYRDEMFLICVPSVFQTTPPQPASNARITLYFLSVGGALANQNGLGDLIPRKSHDKSAI